jgi:hypothetical protein
MWVKKAKLVTVAVVLYQSRPVIVKSCQSPVVAQGKGESALKIMANVGANKL